jgi:hypothetical protein
LQRSGVAGLDETNDQGGTLGGAKHVGILLEIIEAQGAHRTLPSKKLAGAPHQGGARPAAFKPAKMAFQSHE